MIMMDELAFLTAYLQDKTLRTRITAALATLTTQGRAVGYCVVGVVQDPRKEVVPIRNLFPDRIAMRLDEPEQADMVLGDGAHDRGAACELIPTTRPPARGWPTSGWNPTPTRSGSGPDGCPMPTSSPWPTPASRPTSPHPPSGPHDGRPDRVADR